MQKMRFFIMVWLASVLTLAADPANFMLHDFTFDRPAGWQWIETSGDAPRFELHYSGVPHEMGVTTFSLYSISDDRSTIDGTINLWAHNFDESMSKLNVKKESVAIGNRHLTYFTVTGTFHYFSRSVNREIHIPRFTLVGTVIEGKDENIVILLRGGAKVVAQQTPTFKSMIANALAED